MSPLIKLLVFDFLVTSVFIFCSLIFCAPLCYFIKYTLRHGQFNFVDVFISLLFRSSNKNYAVSRNNPRLFHFAHPFTFFGPVIFSYFEIFFLFFIVDSSISDPLVPGSQKGLHRVAGYPVVVTVRVPIEKKARERERERKEELASTRNVIIRTPAYVHMYVQGTHMPSYRVSQRTQRTVHFHFISTLGPPISARTRFCFLPPLQLKYCCVILPRFNPPSLSSTPRHPLQIIVSI